jgi:hypothetical protein
MSAKFGIRSITMPLLTQTMGVWIRYPKGQKYASRLSLEKKLMTELIDQLPRIDYFRQSFHYSIKNWLPFYWRGFQQTTRYTYVLDDLSDMDRVWGAMSGRVRTDIRKARKQLTIGDDLGLDAFRDVNGLTFKRQNRELPYPKDLMQRLDSACEAHSVRRMFFAQDADGRVHAAIYLVWDQESAYYLLSGSDPALRSSGATSLLLWEAIQFASEVTHKFDFEGSMIEPIERSFRSFGGRQQPYFSIFKGTRSPTVKVRTGLKSCIRKVARAVGIRK